MPDSAEALEAFWQTAQFAENCWLSVYCSTKWSLQEPLSSLLCKNKAEHRVFRIRDGCFHTKHRQWPFHSILPLTFSFLTCSLRLRSLWQTTEFGRLAFWGHALHSALHHSCSTGLWALVKTRTYTNSFPLKVKKAPVQIHKWDLLKSTSHQNVLLKLWLAEEDFLLSNKPFLTHLAPRANFPVGHVRAFREEARPAARRARLRTIRAGKGGLGVHTLSGRGGHQGAGDNTLLVANTAAGRALSHTKIHTVG